MISGLENATLWALQLGSAAVAFITMFLMVCSASAAMAWCVLRMKTFLDLESHRMKNESRKQAKSMRLSESDLERLAQ